MSPLGHHGGVPTLVAAPDKFRGTAAAAAVAEAMGAAAWEAGWDAVETPVADGGEGFLDVLGGQWRRVTVTGPLGRPVQADWRLDGSTAVIEMARASGLMLAGGPEKNDPMRASTIGTGELVGEVLRAGAKRVLVGLGGSASTDGGLPCLQAIGSPARLKGVPLIVACDVTTRFVDAAATFAPQKGATPAQVALLTRRLERLAQVYEDDFGVDVRDLDGGGAAGGLAGGLAAWGAELVPGFDVVAEHLDLVAQIERASLVLTGEGFLDEQSFRGKAVGGVVDLALSLGVPVAVICGDRLPPGEVEIPDGVEVVSLVERFGRERAIKATLGCIREAATDLVRRFADGGPGRHAERR